MTMKRTKTNKNYLPDLSDFIAFQEVTEATVQQLQKVAEAEKIVRLLEEELAALDAAGGCFHEMHTLRENIAQAEWDAELARRELKQLTSEEVHVTEQAKEEIKTQARTAGKRIAERILRTVNRLEKLQNDYMTLHDDLQRKALSDLEWWQPGGSPAEYIGPNPGPVLNPYSLMIVDYKQKCDGYLKGRSKEKPRGQKTAAAPMISEITIS